MTTKYKAGDRVEVRVDSRRAHMLNCVGSDGFYIDEIIAHYPASDPVVRWHNVYDTGAVFGGYCSRHDADENSLGDRTCVLRLEWPDGDTSKKPSSVTMEDV